jgi:hypothetical protein
VSLTLQSPALSGRAIPLAKERALDANRKQWGIGASSEQAQNIQSGIPDRFATEAEIWSLFRISSRDVSDADLSSYLESLGYVDGLNQALVTKIKAARSGSLEKPGWVKLEEEASSLAVKALQTEKRGTQLIQEASALKSRIETDLKPKLAIAEQVKSDAEAAAKQVTYVLFSTDY